MVSQMEDFTSSRAFRVSGKQGVRRGRHQHARRRPPDDLRRLRAPADLRPRGPRLLRARRGGELHLASATPRPAASCRSTPTAAASRTCTRACTACTRCRRACGSCAASRRRRSRARRSRSPRRRRHVRRERHDRDDQPGARRRALSARCARHVPAQVTQLRASVTKLRCTRISTLLLLRSLIAPIGPRAIVGHLSCAW